MVEIKLKNGKLDVSGVKDGELKDVLKELHTLSGASLKKLDKKSASKSANNANAPKLGKIDNAKLTAPRSEYIEYAKKLILVLCYIGSLTEKQRFIDTAKTLAGVVNDTLGDQTNMIRYIYDSKNARPSLFSASELVEAQNNLLKIFTEESLYKYISNRVGTIEDAVNGYIAMIEGVGSALYISRFVKTQHIGEFIKINRLAINMNKEVNGGIAYDAPPIIHSEQYDFDQATYDAHITTLRHLVKLFKPKENSTLKYLDDKKFVPLKDIGPETELEIQP